VGQGLAILTRGTCPSWGPGGAGETEIDQEQRAKCHVGNRTYLAERSVVLPHLTDTDTVGRFAPVCDAIAAVGAKEKSRRACDNVAGETSRLNSERIGARDWAVYVRRSSTTRTGANAARETRCGVETTPTANGQVYTERW